MGRGLEKRPKNEELPDIPVVRQEGLTRLLSERGIFTKEEFLEMVKVANVEMKIKPEDI